MIERIRDGRTDLIFDHIRAGGSPFARDEGGVSLIKWCAYYGDVSGVRYLLEHEESLSSLGDNFDLNGAAFHGHWPFCEYLIEQGADPNHRHAQAGETPLHTCLSRANRPQQQRVATVLLAAGADPNAATLPDAETGCFMRDVRSRAETPLHRAAAFASEATIRTLLEAGADREARDMYGDTPLSWASWHLRPAAVVRMLCFGDFRISPAADWTGDHGNGPAGMDLHLLGTPAAARKPHG